MRPPFSLTVGSPCYALLAVNRLSELSPLSLIVRTINIHEAKTHLSRLVEEAARGEPFVIAKAGKPLVKVSALDAPSTAQMHRTGFLSGQLAVPADFDRMGSPEIERLFGSDE